MQTKPTIAIPIGDSAGIAAEILVKMLSAGKIQALCNCVLIGDNRVLDAQANELGLTINYQAINTPDEINPNSGVQLLYQEHPDYENIKRGQMNKSCGMATVKMIITSAHLAKEGKVNGICFAPLNKGSMIMAESPAESEMELFAMEFGVTSGYGEINMVDGVWTTRVTSHVPIKDVSKNLTIDRVFDSILLANNTLKQAGYDNPRIGVAALNPHAGENGLCGNEEITVITPAIEKAKDNGITITGPYPSDILFIKAFAGELDAGVTMFHDQGQIALKLKGFERGITISGGLPTPVTTCAHGTGFDIVGRNIASTISYENALTTACKMVGAKQL